MTLLAIPASGWAEMTGAAASATHEVQPRAGIDVFVTSAAAEPSAASTDGFMIRAGSSGLVAVAAAQKGWIKSARGDPGQVFWRPKV